MAEKFIKFADVPPSPFSVEQLRDYRALGLNVFLLTEDDVRFVENGKITADYKKAIQTIAGQGLTVWIRNMYNDADYFQCDTAKQGTNYGDLYALEPRNVTDEFSAFPAVEGFYMADEAYLYTLPQQLPVVWMNRRANEFADFDKIGKLVDWKNKYYPQSFWHMNHVPSTSWDHYLPQNGKIYDYKDFLTGYTEKILKRLTAGGRSICLDNYPFIGEDYLEYDYLYDLLTAATVARDYNRTAPAAQKATFGICVQAFRAKAINDDRVRDILSAAEITFQLFMGLALGAKLFEFFLYRTCGEMRGILDADGNHRLYDFVKTANETVAVYEEKILNYEFCAAAFVVGTEHSENTRGLIKARDLLTENPFPAVTGSCDTLITVLEQNGKQGFMLLNYSAPVRRQTDYVTVTLPTEAMCSRVLLNGTESEIKNRQLSLKIAPGSAAFIY